MTDQEPYDPEELEAFCLGVPHLLDNLNVPLARTSYSVVNWSKVHHGAWFELKEVKFGRSKLVHTVSVERFDNNSLAFTVVDQKGHLMRCEAAEVLHDGLRRFIGTVDDWGDDIPVLLK